MSAAEKETHAKIERMHGYDGIWHCLGHGFGAGFVVGFGGIVALNTVLKIIRILRKGGAGGGSLAADLIDGALQYGLSAGTVVGMHNAVIHLTRNLSEASPLWRYRGALAGAAGGCGFAFLPRESRRTWAIFLCVRALDQQARILSTKRWVPRPLREFKDADSALMMLVNGFIIYLYIHHPSELSGVYLSFLNRMSQLPLPHVDAVRDMCNGRALDWRAINATTLASAPKGVPLRPSAILKETQAAQQVYDSTPFFLGKVLYPHRNFMPYLSFVAQHFAKGILLSLPMYLQVSGLSGVLFSWKKLLGNPLNFGANLIMNAMRSSCFLAAYCALGLGSLIPLRELGLRFSTTGVMGGNIITYLAGAIGGSCVLLEKKSRRIELALYVMQKVVDALLSLSAIRVRIPAPNIVFASLALMSWSHCNFSYEDALRKSYRSAFRKLFDGRELHSMFIS